MTFKRGERPANYDHHKRLGDVMRRRVPKGSPKRPKNLDEELLEQAVDSDEEHDALMRILEDS